MERPCEPHLMTGPTIQKLETKIIRNVPHFSQEYNLKQEKTYTAIG